MIITSSLIFFCMKLNVHSLYLLFFQGEKCQYMEATRKLLLEKVNKICSKPNLKLPSISDIFYYFLGITFWVVWTWNIININKIVQLSIWLYDTFYKDIEIEGL